MKKVQLPDSRMQESWVFLQPSRPVLVTTVGTDGETHVAPFSWVTPVSANPPRVGLSLLNRPKRQQTLENIERHGEFVVNVPSLDLAEKIVQCSYRVEHGEKKFALACFTVVKSKLVAPEGVAECRAHLECKVCESLILGDHTLVVADVVSLSYAPDCYSHNLLLNLHVATPCLHLESYKTDGGQVHAFLAPLGVRLVEVPYRGDMHTAKDESREKGL